ncbi:MAG: FixH family protein [Methylotenera sp.]|jgi:uncharacterized protein
MKRDEGMNQQETKPWWSYGYVWLVIGGPLVVIIASFITLYFAIKTPDPVIENYYVKGMEINKTLEAEEALAPAMKARNHAQTGVTPKD